MNTQIFTKVQSNHSFINYGSWRSKKSPLDAEVLDLALNGAQFRYAICFGSSRDAQLKKQDSQYFSPLGDFPHKTIKQL